MCDNTKSKLAPFCTPADGTQLSPGQKVSVKWDTNYFNTTNDDALVQIQANYTPSTHPNFSSNYLNPSTGSYGWEIPPSLLKQNDNNAVEAQLYLVVRNNGNEEGRIKGPQVQIAPVGKQGMTVNPVVIAVPVAIVGVLLLAFIGWYLWMRRLRRNPEFGLPGIFGRKKGVSKPADVDVKMWDMGENNLWVKPADGRNVFREEMKRQEVARAGT